MRYLLCSFFPLLIIHTSSAQKVQQVDCQSLKAIIENDDFKSWFHVCDGRRELTLVDTGRIFNDCTITVCNYSIIIERGWPDGLQPPDNGGTIANAKDKLIVYRYSKPNKKRDKTLYIGFWEPVTNNSCGVSILKRGNNFILHVFSKGIF